MYLENNTHTRWHERYLVEHDYNINTLLTRIIIQTPY